MRREQQDERRRPCSLARAMDGDRRWRRMCSPGWMRRKQQDERRRPCSLARARDGWGSARAAVAEDVPARMRRKQQDERRRPLLARARDGWGSTAAAAAAAGGQTDEEGSG
ncbi:Os03g0401225 [Oryza sativa Japonica Group]|uniref:Os03g0401225 protein n=1 Tax=Oryza sativa subsp. japonica TaxID=39947 RepID=A0A0P0VYE8_ORYSJ|nr:Os03g0401225 [Oryza sativa Japonica Group]